MWAKSVTGRQLKVTKQHFSSVIPKTQSFTATNWGPFWTIFQIADYKVFLRRQHYFFGNPEANIPILA